MGWRGWPREEGGGGGGGKPQLPMGSGISLKQRRRNVYKSGGGRGVEVN